MYIIISNCKILMQGPGDDVVPTKINKKNLSPKTVNSILKY